MGQHSDPSNFLTEGILLIIIPHIPYFFNSAKNRSHNSIAVGQLQVFIYAKQLQLDGALCLNLPSFTLNPVQMDYLEEGGWTTFKEVPNILHTMCCHCCAGNLPIVYGQHQRNSSEPRSWRHNSTGSGQ